MDIRQTDLYWFRLNEEIRVEDVDKFSGNNMHPDRMMPQWVLVLMISGERSFRVYGENYVVHSGEFFLLPPYVIPIIFCFRYMDRFLWSYPALI